MLLLFKKKSSILDCFRYTLILTLLFGVSSVLGQIKSIGLPDIINYKKTDYKSGTQNWNIDQDANGNMYFANKNGLLQFDGSNWHTYIVPNVNSIRSVKVEDSTGRIFIGAYNEFGYFESASNGDLTYVSLLPLIKDDRFKKSDFIWKIHLFDDAVIFQSFTAAYIFKDNKISILPAPKRFQFSFKVNNKLYFQDVGSGLLEFINGNLIPIKGTEGLNNSEVWGIVSLPGNTLLITTLESGVYVYKNQTLQHWNTEAGQFISKNGSLGDVVINDSLIVINSVLSGIIICNLQGEIIQHIDLKKGLINNTILSSFIDAKKNLWLGLDNGISYININSPFTYSSSSLNNSSVYASVIHNGLLYVATNQGVFYHKIEDRFKDDTFVLVDGTTAQSWNIQVLSGELLCANNKGALIIEGGKVIKSLNHSGYFGFKQLPNHSKYIIGANYSGFDIFEKTQKGIVFKNKIQNFYESSKDFEVDDAFVWLKKDEFLYQMVLTENLDGFYVTKKIDSINGENNISCMHKINGTLYFIANNHFFSYSKDRGVFEENINLSKLFSDIPPISSLIEDSYGNLWYSYNESLGVFMKNKDGSYKHEFEQFSNLTGKIMSDYLSVNELGHDSFFIGLINGLVCYDSNFSTKTLSKSKVFIRSFSFGKDTIFRGNPQQKSLDLTLPFASNNVRFTFSSPEFENSKNIQYSYQLEPFDKQWSNWSTATVKEYTNLKEDDYKMLVKAKNSYGIDSDVASLTFSISPPWYRSYLAYLVYFLLIILCLYLLSIVQKRILRKKQYYKTIEQRKLYLEKESKIRKEQYELEKEIEKLNRERLQTRILSKDKELVNHSLQVVKKNKILNGIIHKLKEMDVDNMSDDTKFQISKLKKSIIKEVNTDKGLNHLEKHIKNVHFDFLKRLKDKYPDISPRELDLSTYLRLNMSTKEIAEIMNISSGGVELARYRLRKKLNLKRHENLTGFLMSI